MFASGPKEDIGILDVRFGPRETSASMSLIGQKADMEVGRKVTKTGIITAAILVVSSLPIYWHFTAVHAQEEPFEPERWRNLAALAASIDPGCVRGGMALMLVRNSSMLGKSVREVSALLGPPQGGHELRYDLGQCHWGTAHSQLVLSVDEKQTVQGVNIITER